MDLKVHKPKSTQEPKQHVYVVNHKFEKALSIYILTRSSLISNIKIQLQGGELTAH